MLALAEASGKNVVYSLFIENDAAWPRPHRMQIVPCALSLMPSYWQRQNQRWVDAHLIYICKFEQTSHVEPTGCLYVEVEDTHSHLVLAVGVYLLFRQPLESGNGGRIHQNVSADRRTQELPSVFCLLNYKIART